MLRKKFMKKKLVLISIIILVILLSIIIKEKRLEVNDLNKEFLFGSNDYVLGGILISRMYYGPPGYGENTETDSKEYPYILQLNQPINIKAMKDDNMNVDVSNIYEVQLEMTKEQYNILKEYENKNIKLEGSFFSKLTGHHHTDVLFKVKKILK